MEKIIIETNCRLSVEKGKCHHSNKNKGRVFSNILEQVNHKRKTFKHTVGQGRVVQRWLKVIQG